MDQIAMEQKTSYLPQEMIADILVRLPLKSLIRFQCVCKDWKYIFKTPYFITEHLHHSTQQNPLLAVDYETSKLCLLTRDMQVHEFQNPPIIDSSEDAWKTFHSSHGLLCVKLIFNGSDSFWLWNPSIREVQQVPRSLNYYDSNDFFIGFGFSPIVNDYKIVKLFVMDHFVVDVEVYALSASSWRKVELRNLKGLTLTSDSHFTFNGSIFWIGFKEESDPDLIVSFDIATEVFTFMPFPPFPTFLDQCFNRLTMYDNKLATLSSTVIGNHESSFINLWVMEGCTYAWTKIYTSRSYPCWLSPMIIWRNEMFCRVEIKHIRKIEGELENDEAKIVFINLTTEVFNRFAIKKCSYIYQICDYVESLVPVSNIRIEEP